MLNSLALLSSLVSMVAGQQIATITSEIHPSLTWSKCTSSGCTTQTGKITVDANYRWIHGTGGYTNCYTYQTGWDATLCSDGKTCASKCALEGADYSGTYGITTSGNAVTLKFVTGNAGGMNVGSQVFLLNNDTRYEMFNPLGQEFIFDVDVSKLPCGVNGALYLSEMDADGGMAKYPSNKAGAKYGTGYCDSNCPRDQKFINGERRPTGQRSSWTVSPTSGYSGVGQWGACCSEMDIWQANALSTAYTPHPCSSTSLTRCDGSSCGTTDRYATVCDPDGCEFNPYRMGSKTFYGKGLVVDTTKKFTVVTQFLTDTGSSSGTLKEICRLYVQNGKVIQNSEVNIVGMDPSMDSITDAYCDARKSVFGDRPQFQNMGGLARTGKALANGMVLVFSVADDHSEWMRWLDSSFPSDANQNTPSVLRGPCATSAGRPSDIEVIDADAQVTFSNIRVGTLGSTYRTGSTTITMTIATNVAH